MYFDINGHLSKENLLISQYSKTDDTAGPKSGLNLNELIDKVNVEVNKLANWFRVNKMAVNVSKTKYIIFKPKGVTESTLNLTRGLYLTKIKFDAQKIKLKSPHEIPDPCNRSYKLLGLYLDEHLTFDYHCEHVYSKISQSNFIINRAK